jgi:hypothetical protein
MSKRLGITTNNQLNLFGSSDKEKELYKALSLCYPLKIDFDAGYLVCVICGEKITFQEDVNGIQRHKLDCLWFLSKEDNKE